MGSPCHTCCVENGESRSVKDLEDELERFLALGDMERCGSLTLELVDVYQRAGRNHDALETLRIGTGTWNLNDFPRVHAELCAAEGTLLHYTMREPDLAIPAYREAIGTFSGIDDSERVADMAYNLGNAYCAAGRFNQAASGLRESVNGFQELGRRADESDARIALAIALKGAGSEEAANQQISAASELAEALGEPLRAVRYLTGLGAGLEDLDPDDSLWATQRAISLARPRVRDVDDVMDLADCMSALGRQYVRLGDYPQAEATFAECLDLIPETDVRGQILALADCCTAEIKLGDLGRAESTLQRIDSLIQNEDLPDVNWIQGLLENTRGNLYLNRGELAEALQCLMAADVLLRESGDTERQRNNKNDIAAVLLGLGRGQEAVPLLRAVGSEGSGWIRAIANSNLASALGPGHPESLGLAESAYDTLRGKGVDGVRATALLAVVYATSDHANDQQAISLVAEADRARPEHQTVASLILLAWADELLALGGYETRLRQLRAKAAQDGNESGVAYSIFLSAEHDAEQRFWNSAIRKQREGLRLLSARRSAQLIEPDVALALYLSASTASMRFTPVVRRRLREALRLAVPALLAVEALRRSRLSEVSRNTLGWEDSWARAIALWASLDLNDLRVHEEIAVYLNSIGSLRAEAAQRLPYWQVSTRLGTSDPGQLSRSAAESERGPAAHSLSAGLVGVLSPGDSVPVSLPPRIYLEDGRAALGSFADLAQDRYGFSVFADEEADRGRESHP